MEIITETWGRIYGLPEQGSHQKSEKRCLTYPDLLPVRPGHKFT